MKKNVCNTAFLYSLAVAYAQVAITNNSQTPALYIIIKTKVRNNLSGSQISTYRAVKRSPHLHGCRSLPPNTKFRY